MIYLIITTSINNKFSVINSNEMCNERRDRYLYAISETLKQLPHEIKPIIVENNGKRETYLDNFYHHHRQHVKVFYTENNTKQFKSKGTNELLDIKEVIDRYGIEDDDIIIYIPSQASRLNLSFQLNAAPGSAICADHDGHGKYEAWKQENQNKNAILSAFYFRFNPFQTLCIRIFFPL